jgi:hypothetical protein
MFEHSKNWSAAAAAALLLLVSCAASSGAGLPQAQAGNQSAARPIGAIKSIEGNTVTLTSDSGALFTVPIEAGIKILRIEPGAKDLKNAEPLQPSDLQVGDRILVLGKVADDGHSVAATAVVVMKKADVASKQERERQDWQRRGVGGLVTAVDAAAGTITISTQSFAGSKNVTVHVGKDTVVRRYAPDSVKFDDAKISSIDQVKPGDQLRARGTRSADGMELAAEEIVTGAFQNIPGTVVSVDASAGNVTVANLISKKNVMLKVTAESQLRKLPPPLAQMMAMRLKGAQAGGAEGGQAAAAGGAGRPAGGNQAGPAENGGRGGGNAENPGRGRNGGGGGDFQQILGRLPAATLGDLQKGDAVMIVATEGSSSGGGTVITLLAGVEPLLAASPSMVLPPWSLEAPGGGDAGQ